MYADGFIFTGNAPAPKKKKFNEQEENLLFGSSKWNKDENAPKQERVRVVYVPRPQPNPPMGYSREPRYGYQRPEPRPGYQRPLPRQQKPINLIKTINETQRALQKYSKQRREAKLNENKRLKAEVDQRLALLKAKNETERLKKANWALKTAKAREATAKAKEGIGNAFGFIKSKFPAKKKVNLPLYPQERNE